MDKITTALGVVRHVLSFAGGALIALGVVSGTDWTSALTSFDGVTGGVLTLIAVVGSIVNKLRQFNVKAVLTGAADPTKPAA